jgi:hypothetical protein
MFGPFKYPPIPSTVHRGWAASILLHLRSDIVKTKNTEHKIFFSVHYTFCSCVIQVLSMYESLYGTHLKPVLDPCVFGPPGSASGSVSHKYGSGSGSGSFHHQAKIVRKTLVSTVLWLLYDFYHAVFRIRILIRIRRIRMFLDLPDPHPETLDKGTDERNRIRIRIRTKMSWIHNTAYNTPCFKCI